MLNHFSSVCKKPSRSSDHAHSIVDHSTAEGNALIAHVHYNSDSGIFTAQDAIQEIEAKVQLADATGKVEYFPW